MQSLIIGVAGGTGSGKTTVANAIIDRVGRERIALVEHDSYYRDQSDKPLEVRARVNYDHPDSLETDLMIEHLKQLRMGNAVQVPVYDFATHTRKQETKRMDPRPVIMVEGILIFVDRALREMFDVKVFVDTDADIRMIRRLQRDMEERGRTFDSVITQYRESVRPMHLEFVEPSKRYADIILPEGGFNTVGLDLISARIQMLLEV